MAELRVEVVQIDTVTPHPNADRLDLITIFGMGYEVITGRGNLEVGDLAFYFPIDSVIPDEWVNKFGISSYYSTRLRATKLRGIFSEGLLIPVKTLKLNEFIYAGKDFTEYFGVTKYEPPVKFGRCGGYIQGKNPNPIGEHRFPSPEHLKKYKTIFQDGEEVVITEKIHGMNFSIHKDTDGNIKIASHNVFWDDTPENETVPQIRLFHQSPEFLELPNHVIVYGEVYGNKIQDLTYGLSDIDYALFAVSKEGTFLDYDDFVEFCNYYKLKRSPELYRGVYSYEVVQQFNNSSSVICRSQISEGVCVIPVKERWDRSIQARVCMKFVSENYLLRKNGTEDK
jgi:RNA ligase (TIGR02306 family)